MKKNLSFLLAVALISLSMISLLGKANAVLLQPNHIIVYYFHGHIRCPTCHKLEQYSKEAVEANFKDEIAYGRIEFKVVNVEEKGNEYFLNDYQLYTKSLVLSLVKDGKEVKSKNLEKIWEYVGDKQRFVGYVKEEVSNFLKEQ